MTAFSRFLAMAITGSILAVLPVTGAGEDADFSEGVKLLAKGSYEAATKKLASAYKKHPDNPEIALAYAKVAPGSLSVAIFTRCAKDTNSADSLRAVAYAELGNYSFVHSAFKTAAEKYRLASTLYSDPYYRHRWAMASAALHDIKTARSLWKTITLEHGTELARQAWYYLALLDMEEKGLDAAYAKLEKCGPPDSLRAWTVAATAAKLECAISLGKTKAVSVLEQQLLPYGDLLLERDLLTLAGLHAGNNTGSAVPEKTVAAATGKEERYTLQVGAFGSVENATRLQKKLALTFKEVTVLPVTLGDQVFYRVRVGTFSSREEAESFGTDSLEAAGIAFKAVVQ